MKSLQEHVCALTHFLNIQFLLRDDMLAIRLYISALTLVFLFIVITNRSLGVLAGLVITCAIIYLIIDARDELKLLKLEVRGLQDLEQRITALLR